MPEKPFEIFEEDFTKTMMDYLMFKQEIDVKEFSESLVKKVMYESNIISQNNNPDFLYMETYMKNLELAVSEEIRCFRRN